MKSLITILTLTLLSCQPVHADDDSPSGWSVSAGSPASIVSPSSR